MTDRPVIAAGGCQCGAVRYALLAVPEGSVCHCRMCQKATGGPFAALAKIAKTDVVWTRGKPAAFRSSPAAERDFCAACGTPLGFRFRDAPHMEVTIGSLDRPDLVPPERNFGVESRLGWVAGLVPGIWPDETTEEAAGEGGAKRDLRSRQHPDHETSPDWQPPL